MPNEQIKVVCNLIEQTITRELGLRCGHYIQGKGIYSRPGYQLLKKYDFYVNLPSGTNGNIKARLLVKDGGLHVCVYETDFKEMREKIRVHERETEKHDTCRPLRLDRISFRALFEEP